MDFFLPVELLWEVLPLLLGTASLVSGSSVNGEEEQGGLLCSSRTLKWCLLLFFLAEGLGKLLCFAQTSKTADAIQFMLCSSLWEKGFGSMRSK